MKQLKKFVESSLFILSLKKPGVEFPPVHTWTDTRIPQKKLSEKTDIIITDMICNLFNA